MKLFDRCLDLLYPPRCVFCDALLQPGEEYFCRACGEKVPMAAEDQLVKTGASFDRCVAPLLYQEMVRESFLDYKFHDKSWRSAIYAALLAPYVQQEFPDVQLITWVPLSRRSYKDRGYDQSELVAKELAKRLDLPCEKVLQKTRDTQQQSRLENPEERRGNVLGAYEVRKNCAVQGKRVLLVDDVITTGSTMEECGRVLMTAGAQVVHCAALAQAVGKVAQAGESGKKKEKEV